MPVRYSGIEGEQGRLRIVPETDIDESHEELTWDDFFDEFEREDHVVVYHGREHAEPFEVVTRDEAIGRATLDDEAVEEALLEGETITSEVRETRVIERTIVEEATVESEVTDRQIVEEDVVDAELLTREVVEVDLLDAETIDAGWSEPGAFDVGYRLEAADGLGLELELVVDESWSVTKEVVEQLTIESRAVDTDVTETDTVETDTVETSIDIEGVQQQVVESDLVDTEATGTEVIEGDTIRSEYGEGAVVHTQIHERKTVEEEVSLRRRLTGEITEGETTSVDTFNRQVIESEIVDEADVGAGAGARGAGTGTRTGTIEETPGTDEPARADARMPTEDDEGKTVVDARGEDVGMVVEVRGGTMYVDPHPSLTDRIKAALDWGDVEDDTYPVTSDQIARITSTEVELAAIESGHDEASERSRR